MRPISFLLVLLACQSAAAWNVERVPFDRILRVDAAGYPGGLAHGRREALAIRRLVRRWLRPKLILLPLVSPGFFSRALAEMEPYLGRERRDEIAGIADGAGVSYRDGLIANAFPDLAELLGKDSGCSTLAVSPARSGGGLLVGRNLDYPLSQVVRDYWRPVIFATPGRRRVLAIEVPGFTGVLTGINDAGVFLARLTSVGDDATAAGTPTPLLFREILESASTADEAIALYRRARRTVPINVAITDPKAARVLEIGATKSAVRDWNDAGVLYAANHYVTPEMRVPGEGPDRRWAILGRFDGDTSPLELDDVVSTLCAAGGLEGTRPRTNVLAVFVDYGRRKLYFGSDSHPNGKASCGERFREVDLAAFLAQ